MSSTRCSATFFIGLSGIELPQIGQPGIQISKQLRITNDRSAIARMISSYASSTGMLEQNYLVNMAGAVIYSREHINVPVGEPADFLNGVVIDRLSEVQVWLMKLWLVKDNAVDPDVGWLAVDFSGQPAVNSNRWSTLFSCADGSNTCTTFTKDDLEKAKQIPLLSDDFGFGTPVPVGVSGARNTRITQLSHDTVRYQRFLYYVNAARSTKDVAIKIALYCSGLESIVSSSHAELTHQVSERVATLLREKGEDQLKVFRQVKLAYGFRSKAVHGAVFRDKDHHTLVESSNCIDQLCREVALAYLKDKKFREALTGSDEEFNTYWMQNLFLK